MLSAALFKDSKTVIFTLKMQGCTLQINEPQLQRSKHQRATHQRLSTSTVSG
jgi:hypothetical protein